MNTFFLILGPNIEDDTQYWDDASQQWTTDMATATKFNRTVLCSPIPNDTVAVVELNQNMTAVNFYRVERLPIIQSPFE